MGTGKLMQALEVSLPPRLQLQPVWRDTETEWEIPVRYTMAGMARASHIGLAIQAINRTMKPLPAKEIAQELAKLNALTIRRKEHQGDLNLMVAAYVEKLAPFSGEAIIHVLRRWPQSENGKWWPSWAELYEMLEYRTGERRLMLEALG